MLIVVLSRNCSLAPGELTRSRVGGRCQGNPRQTRLAYIGKCPCEVLKCVTSFSPRPFLSHTSSTLHYSQIHTSPNVVDVITTTRKMFPVIDNVKPKHALKKETRKKIVTTLFCYIVRPSPIKRAHHGKRDCDLKARGLSIVRVQWGGLSDVLNRYWNTMGCFCKVFGARRFL